MFSKLLSWLITGAFVLLAVLTAFALGRDFQNLMLRSFAGQDVNFGILIFPLFLTLIYSVLSGLLWNIMTYDSFVKREKQPVDVVLWRIALWIGGLVFLFFAGMSFEAAEVFKTHEDGSYSSTQMRDMAICVVIALVLIYVGVVHLRRHIISDKRKL